MLNNAKIPVDKLIEVVKRGGSVKTGTDVYNNQGVLLLEKDVMVNSVKPLEIIKSAGVAQVPFNTFTNGGIWDKNGEHHGIVIRHNDLDLSGRYVLQQNEKAMPPTSGGWPISSENVKS